MKREVDLIEKVISLTGIFVIQNWRNNHQTINIDLSNS